MYGANPNFSSSFDGELAPVATSTSTATSTTLTNNLVSYYKLDGNSTDSAGTNNGADTAVTYGSSYGKINQGAYLGGGTSKVILPSTVNVSGDSPRTIAAWVKTTANGGAIYGSGSLAAGTTFNVFMGGTGSNNGTIDINQWNGTDIVSPVVINNGAWHHVVVTYAGGGFNTTNVKIYIDGTLSSATGGAGNTLNTNNSFYGIGAYAGGDYFNLVGSLDETGVWNRALSGSEVSQLYSNGVGIQYPFTSMPPAVSATQYMARVDDGSFRQYTYATSTDSWIMYDKKGTEYIFGASNQSKENSSATSTQTYKWMLEKIVDTNNNFVRYVYTKDSLQLYPSQIIYTGNGSTDGPFTITFSTSTRPDPSADYLPGFKVTTNYRISQITASVGSNWVRKYALSYTTGNNGYRSLLSGIQETGQDDSNNQVTLPAMTFNYMSSSTPFVSAGQQGHGWVYADVNGDGTTDSAVLYQSPYNGQLYNSICPNNNSSGCGGASQTPSYWASQSNGADPYPAQETGTRFVDLNGDGKADVVQGVYNYTTSTSTNNVFLNAYATSSGYAWNATSTGTGTMPPFELTGSGSMVAVSTGILGDVNGDGLPDYELRLDGNGSLSPATYIGNGSTFDATFDDF